MLPLMESEPFPQNWKREVRPNEEVVLDISKSIEFIYSTNIYVYSL